MNTVEADAQEPADMREKRFRVQVHCTDGTRSEIVDLYMMAQNWNIAALDAQAIAQDAGLIFNGGNVYINVENTQPLEQLAIAGCLSATGDLYQTRMSFFRPATRLGARS